MAGFGAGLKGSRSGTFWPFWSRVEALVNEHRAPRLIVLENVCGALSSHNGQDFEAIANVLNRAGYVYGAMVIDAVHFVPQSRPRLFIVAARSDQEMPDRLTTGQPISIWHPAQLIAAYEKLQDTLKTSWVWWRLPLPPLRTAIFADLIEKDPQGVSWNTTADTSRLLEMMSDVNRRKVINAQRMGRQMIGTIYKRTRPNKNGERSQRAEIRFDNIAGCLRTPAGGSSRQSILIVNGDDVRSRLLSPREAARLMGLPETYTLPEKYNDAYHLAGDGLVVPVVRFLASHVLEPFIAFQRRWEREVA